MSSFPVRVQTAISKPLVRESTEKIFALGDWHGRQCPSPRLETEEQVLRKLVNSVLVIQTIGTIFHGVLSTLQHFAKDVKKARP